jgi:hypothetical protein
VRFGCHDKARADLFSQVPDPSLPARPVGDLGVVLPASVGRRHVKDAGMTVFLLCGAVWFLLDATLLWRARPYSTWQMRAFLLGWNLIALASMSWVWATASLTH